MSDSKLYTIIGDTNVYSEPSILSDVIDKKVAGNIVFGALHNEWLKVGGRGWISVSSENIAAMDVSGGKSLRQRCQDLYREARQSSIEFKRALRRQSRMEHVEKHVYSSFLARTNFQRLEVEVSTLN